MQQALLGDWTEQRSSQRSARSKGVQGGNCRRTIPTSQDLSANNCQHIETAEFGRRKKGDKHRTTAPRNGDSELALVRKQQAVLCVGLGRGAAQEAKECQTLTDKRVTSCSGAHRLHAGNDHDH